MEGGIGHGRLEGDILMNELNFFNHSGYPTGKAIDQEGDYQSKLKP